jgi:hypothetical protein
MADENSGEFPFNIDEILRANEEHMRKSVDVKLKVSLDGFKSAQDKFVIGDDLIIERGIHSEREQFFTRASAFDKTYESTVGNEFFATFDFSTTFGNLNGVSPGQHLNIISYFFAVCFTHPIRANIGQTLVKRNETFVSGGYFKTSSELVQTARETFTDNDISLMVNVWPKFKVLFRTSLHFGLITRRYFYSLTRYQWEDQLIDLVISLEAFFIPESGVNDKNKGGKIAKRVSRLLESLWPRGEISKVINRCYDIRNKVVHGNIIEDTEWKIREQIDQLSTITRSAIHQYLIYHSDHSIADFVKQIDTRE